VDCGLRILQSPPHPVIPRQARSAPPNFGLQNSKLGSSRLEDIADAREDSQEVAESLPQPAALVRITYARYEGFGSLL
jgi:hypothetical protein